jgi:lipoprotein NlpD
MSFYTTKLNFPVILMVLALSNARTIQAYYAPVKTDNKEQQNTAAKNASARQKKIISSVPEKTRHEDKNAHKKQQTKLDVAKKSKRQQQKSIVSIDNNKILELNFVWPIKGRVLKSFSPSRNKGIDIAGKKGQSVKATEAGKIVYGRQGLLGFGKLLIIKHNNNYLSAYANNSRLLVKEGQHVKKGQVIAEVGDVGIKRTSLHFEIRKNGKPVNPLELLPKK